MFCNRILKNQVHGPTQVFLHDDVSNSVAWWNCSIFMTKKIHIHIFNKWRGKRPLLDSHIPIRTFVASSNCKYWEEDRNESGVASQFISEVITDGVAWTPHPGFSCRALKSPAGPTKCNWYRILAAQLHDKVLQLVL